MNAAKKLLTGLPLFNFLVIIGWWGLESLEIYFNPVTEYSAPATMVGFFVFLLLMGGFGVWGFIIGVFKAIKYNSRWKNIVIQIIILTIIIESMYLIFYFFRNLNNHTFIIRDTLTITLQQISGYIVGCSVGKLIRYFTK